MNPNSFDTIDGIRTYKLFIDGKWVASSRNRLADSLNPATGQVFARTHQVGAEKVLWAIDAAEKANAAWGNSLAREREQQLLLRTCDVIMRQTVEVRDMLIKGCRRTLSGKRCI